MPRISEFFGIVIYIYAKEHLPPHLHAIYQGKDAMIDITTGELIKGKISRRALRLVQDWIEIHQKDLLENFEESQKDIPNFKKIEPLK
ncbi:MAG: DUF4160 domain-containing protein [Bacteroidia bacterium]|nr:DUF4160 domain-containing protein [Bacteroidia bacterium]